MKFIRSEVTNAVRDLDDQLVHQLRQKKRVLWLVPGGSNIPYVAEIMTDIPVSLTSQLTIMLTDERYGAVGHLDSNARQLEDIGFDPKHALFIPVLTGGTFDETVRAYRTATREQLAANDVAIGQFGIGTDGHIAGMLPGSPAAAEQHELAVGYQAPTFLRISLTSPAIRQLDIAYALVYGATKHEALTLLHDRELSLEQQPAQILKAIPEAYVYNDQVEA